MAKLDENISAIGGCEAEGSSQLKPCRQKIKITCLICCRHVFHTIQPEVEEENKKNRNAIIKNLCDELHLRWDEIPDVCLEDMFPLCKGCFKKVERLWEYNEEITRIQEKKQATVLDIRKTVTKGEVFRPQIRNSNPLVVAAEAKKFKRLREVVLKANRDELRNDSQNDDGLIDDSSYRNENIGIVTQNLGSLMTAVPNEVAVVDGFKPIAAPRICNSHFPCASRVNNFNDKDIMDQNYCVFCAKSFPNKGAVMQHLLSHTREKPFSCIVCCKEFGQIGNFTRHIRTHTGERPFKCNLCFKTFNEKGSLGSHIRTHTGEKPFKCNLCFKTFNQKCNLLTHLAIHTGEKPYKCNLCFKTFSQKCHVVYHLKTHFGK